jgi:tRNA (guanine37-N1)-methyltransferase
MRFDIVTIFPEYFTPLEVSLLGKARQRGDVVVAVHDLRDWAYDRHRKVDDTPYGGGPGMVMKPEPWGEAIGSILSAVDVGPRMVVPTPSGRPFTQELAVEYAGLPWLLFACGRYEGIDSRVAEDARGRMQVDEVSIGDYVLAGGEAAVLVMVEAVSRLLPGVLGNVDSVTDDSFAPGEMGSLLEGPVYTKPPSWRGQDVPEVLLSGNHAAIARWRRDQALCRTAANRPELLDRNDLDKADRQALSDAGFPISGERMAH